MVDACVLCLCIYFIRQNVLRLSKNQSIATLTSNGILLPEGNHVSWDAISRCRLTGERVNGVVTDARIHLSVLCDGSATSELEINVEGLTMSPENILHEIQLRLNASPQKQTDFVASEDGTVIDCRTKRSTREGD